MLRSGRFTGWSVCCRYLTSQHRFTSINTSVRNKEETCCEVWEGTRQVIGLMCAELKLELLTAGSLLHRDELCAATSPSTGVRKSGEAHMPLDLNGYWKMISNDNFEEFMKALDINVAIRKIAKLLKPDKEIIQNGDHMIIRTLSTFRNYNMEFDVGKEFFEDLAPVDGRKCMTTIRWEGDKLVCVQKGEIEGRGWTHWMEGDQLYLELRAGGVACKQVFKKT